MSAAEHFDALVSLTVTAGRSLQRSLFSLDPDHQRATKELAAFLLGIFRSLEALDARMLTAWQERCAAELGLDVLELCRRTGEPAFMEAGFLAFLGVSEEPRPPVA
jgi:hypothetical protein